MKRPCFFICIFIFSFIFITCDDNTRIEKNIVEIPIYHNYWFNIPICPQRYVDSLFVRMINTKEEYHAFYESDFLQECDYEITDIEDFFKTSTNPNKISIFSAQDLDTKTFVYVSNETKNQHMSAVGTKAEYCKSLDEYIFTFTIFKTDPSLVRWQWPDRSYYWSAYMVIDKLSESAKIRIVVDDRSETI